MMETNSPLLERPLLGAASQSQKSPPVCTERGPVTPRARTGVQFNAKNRA